MQERNISKTSYRFTLQLVFYYVQKEGIEMDFKKAYQALKEGHKIKREHWKGYWVKEKGTITMHCKDGSVIPFLETDDIFVDLDNIVADNWIICDDIDETTLNIQTFTFGEAISNLKRGKTCIKYLKQY